MVDSAPTPASLAAPRGGASAASGGRVPRTADLLLDVSDLHAGYGKAEVLSGLALQVPRGRVVTVIGPNGAGKSTLLKSLFGLVPVRSGSVTLRGVDITAAKAHRLVGLGVGYVPQNNNVFQALTVEENLEMGVYQRPKAFAQRF